MNLALHSHASLSQDPFCEDSAVPVIIYHSSEQVQYGFFKNNNAIRETRWAVFYYLHLPAERVIFSLLPSIQKGFICVCMCRRVPILTVYVSLQSAECSIGTQPLLILI